ncbi:MAG: hypothetical protein RBU45_06065 [Myxococcota bacterium]|nr:hypothetical protein [Myxococcota bacterium]
MNKFADSEVEDKVYLFPATTLVQVAALHLFGDPAAYYGSGLVKAPGRSEHRTAHGVYVVQDREVSSQVHHPSPDELHPLLGSVGHPDPPARERDQRRIYDELRQKIPKQEFEASKAFYRTQLDSAGRHIDPELYAMAEHLYWDDPAHPRAEPPVERRFGLDEGRALHFLLALSFRQQIKPGERLVVNFTDYRKCCGLKSTNNKVVHGDLVRAVEKLAQIEMGMMIAGKTDVPGTPRLDPLLTIIDRYNEGLVVTLHEDLVSPVSESGPGGPKAGGWWIPVRSVQALRMVTGNMRRTAAPLLILPLIIGPAHAVRSRAAIAARGKKPRNSQGTRPTSIQVKADTLSRALDCDAEKLVAQAKSMGIVNSFGFDGGVLTIIPLTWSKEQRPARKVTSTVELKRLLDRYYPGERIGPTELGAMLDCTPEWASWFCTTMDSDEFAPLTWARIEMMDIMIGIERRPASGDRAG